MEGKKSLTSAKADFVETLLQSVSGLPREAAEQRLSNVIADLWNYCETQVLQMPARPKQEEF